MMKREPMTATAAWLVAVTAASLGCARRPGANAVAAQNRSNIERYVEAMNRGDASYLDDYLAPGYVYHGPAGDLDQDGFTQFHKTFLAAFPGGTMIADDIVAAGDKVVTRWTFHGVQRGEFQGIAPTDKPVTVTGIIISRFENGRAVEEWEEADLLGLLRQLGVLPAPEAGTAEGNNTPHPQSETAYRQGA